MIAIADHPFLDLGFFVTEYAVDLHAIVPPPGLLALLGATADAPLRPDDEVKVAIRALLRHGGFKPAGRSKPSSEYLRRAAAEGGLTSINVAVDAGNAVSLHSGLPISVVDLDLVGPPLRVDLAPPGTSYPFNPSGQEIDVSRLLCLFDATGTCANAVKDAQRTKTHAATRRTLSLVWGTTALGDRTQRTVTWYRDLVEETGGATRLTVE